jgi:hypothetical protein
VRSELVNQSNCVQTTVFCYSIGEMGDDDGDDVYNVIADVDIIIIEFSANDDDQNLFRSSFKLNQYFFLFKNQPIIIEKQPSKLQKIGKKY